MTREEQIKAIYEKVSDKTLSFGCNTNFGIILSYKEKKYGFIYNGYDTQTNYYDEIISHGHPVMIGDVLDYIDRNLFRNPSKYEGVFEIDIQAREKCVITLYNHFIGRYRSPIEKLDDNAIEFIYNLIKE